MFTERNSITILNTLTNKTQVVYYPLSERIHISYDKDNNLIVNNEVYTNTKLIKVIH